MNYIEFKKDGYLGELTIHRPAALNALNSEVLAELSTVLDEIKKEDIRVLIVTGGGEKSFVAGADIAEMWNLTPDQAKAFCLDGNAVMRKIEEMPMPVIAAINGYALGGGCELALSCDIRLAAVNAVFGFPEVSLGIVPGYGGMQRLSRLIGTSMTKKLIFSAMRIRAEEALALGLIDQVCEKEQLLAEAKALAVQIINNAPVAVREAKKVINASVGLTLKESQGLEAEGFADCFKTEDQHNAMGVFLKKLEPVPFQGK